MTLHEGPKFSWRAAFAVVGLAVCLSAADVPVPAPSADQAPPPDLDLGVCDQLPPPVEAGSLIPIPLQASGEAPANP